MPPSQVGAPGAKPSAVAVTAPSRAASPAPSSLPELPLELPEEPPPLEDRVLSALLSPAPELPPESLPLEEPAATQRSPKHDRPALQVEFG